MGGEAAEIETLKTRAGAAGARCLFAGKRPPSELPAFLAAASVLVSPRCRGANTPFKIYTYLASGKPLVATRIPTHTQLLDDSLAFLVEPTPEGLAAGIRQTLQDPAEAAERATRGRELIERDYSAARYLEKVRGVYESLARKRSLSAEGPEQSPRP
jgi:glycosyltransferase involved in cell wall biosynthesis